MIATLPYYSIINIIQTKVIIKIYYNKKNELIIIAYVKITNIRSSAFWDKVTTDILLPDREYEGHENCSVN